jgi:hypothetical protein
MHTGKHRSRASRRRTLTRGAREILLAIAPVARTLALAPPIAMAIVQFGRLVVSIQRGRVERMGDSP